MGRVPNLMFTYDLKMFTCMQASPCGGVAETRAEATDGGGAGGKVGAGERWKEGEKGR